MKFNQEILLIKMLTPADVEKFIEETDNSGKNIYSIIAKTGTGKSTTFPIEFAKRRRTVMIVQPTVAAALSLAVDLRKRVPGNIIGTATEGNVNYENKRLYVKDTKTTPIVYCTSGHFKNILLKMADRGKGIKFVDYIMLDEAHTGNLDYDLIMYLFQYLLDKEQPLPKLILASATPAKIPFKDSDIYTTQYEGRSYPVDISYHHKDYDTTQNSQRLLYSDVAEVVRNKHRQMPVQSDKTDAWLIFCPGKEEIMRVMKGLEDLSKVVVIPAYSSLGEDQMKFLDNPPLGFRKIVVSTNIAESSITIPGLTGVFDTLYEKILVTGGNGGTMLSTEYISKGSAEQRKGRAGRTNPGFCYRMCTEKAFNNLNLARVREIERIPPDRMILDLIGRNLKVNEIIFDGSIPEKTIESVTKRLQDIGLLSSSGNTVTDAGKFVQTLQLSPRMGMFYWLWKKNTKLPVFVGALIASVIDSYGQGYSYTPREVENKEDYKSKYFSRYKSRSGLRSMLKIFIELFENFKTLRIESHLLTKYSVDNSLNNQRVKDALRNLKSLLEKIPGQVNIGSFNVDRAVDAAMPYLIQAYKDVIFTKNSQNHTVRPDVVFFIPIIYNYVIPIIQMETKGGKNTVILYESTNDIDVDFVIPVSLSKKKESIVVEDKEPLPEVGDPIFVDTLESIYNAFEIDPDRDIWFPDERKIGNLDPSGSKIIDDMRFKLKR